jgi:hypothetical protein
MTERTNRHADRQEGVDLEPRDRRLVEAIAENYRPEPMTFEQSAAFDRELRARMQQPAGNRSLISAAAFAGALATVAALAWVAITEPWTETSPIAPQTAVSSTDDAPSRGSVEEPAVAPEEEFIDAEYLAFATAIPGETNDTKAVATPFATGDYWTDEVLGAHDAVDFDDPDLSEAEYLPSEYLAIAALLLDRDV